MDMDIMNIAKRVEVDWDILLNIVGKSTLMGLNCQGCLSANFIY